MSHSTEKVKFTYEDALLLPEDKQCEVIDGDLLMVPAPSPYHQVISARIGSPMQQLTAEKNLGIVLHAPIDVYLSEYDVVRPDILFVSGDRLGIIGERKIEGAPDLVVEILSPSSKEKDRRVKRKLYERYGVREYWIVEPDSKSIEVLRRSEARLVTRNTFTAGEDLRSKILPGLQLEVEPIFEKIQI